MKKRFLNRFSPVLLLMAILALIIIGCKDDPEPPKYTVTFDGNAGSVTVNNLPDPIKGVAKGAVISKPTPNPSRTDGYAFVNWYKEATGTELWDFDVDKVNKNTTLYAKWLANTYTVTFDSQSATTPANPGTKNVTVPLTTIDALPTPPVRTGYTFGNWWTQANGAGTQFTAATPVTANITVYANWTANTLSISYANGGGTGTNPSSPTSAAYGTNVTMPNNPYTRTGYTFAGWAVSGTGSVAGTHLAAANVAVSALSTGINTGAASITLTATWTANTLSISYANGGGTGTNPSSPTSAAYGTDVTMPNNPYTRTGYTFAGWAVSGTGAIVNTHAAAASVAVSALSTGINTGAASIVLTAAWTANTYTVTFDSQDATTPANPATKQVTVPTTTIDALPSDPIKTGYSFEGWWTQENGAGTQFTATTPVTATITVYAKWELIPTGAQVLLYWVNEDFEIEYETTGLSSLTLSRAAGNSLTFTADDAAYSEQTWFVNGVKVSENEDFIFSSAGRANGDYEIGLMVKYGGKYYSTEFTVKVRD